MEGFKSDRTSPVENVEGSPSKLLDDTAEDESGMPYVGNSLSSDPNERWVLHHLPLKGTPSLLTQRRDLNDNKLGKKRRITIKKTKNVCLLALL